MEELIPITLFLCVAGVLILRPVTRRLGVLLETMARERQAHLGAASPVQPHGREAEAQAAAATRLVEHVSRRIDLIEERMEFLERLADSRQREGRRLSGASG